MAACARGLPGWERLLTSKDRAERATVRVVLERACVESDERQATLLKGIRAAAHQGTVDAFK